MLRLIGLGLSIDSIPLGNLKKLLLLCDKIFVDAYTSVWFPDINILVKTLLNMKKDVIIAKRYMLEGSAIENVVNEAMKKDVCIAVVGDPLIATTHSIIIVEALKKGVEVDVSPATSIFNTAISISCLQIYRFGKVATIVSSKNGVVYEYPFTVLKMNREQNLHTLFLLEIDVEKKYYMKPNEGIELIMNIQKGLGEKVLANEDIVIVIADAFSRKQKVFVLSVEEAMKKTFNENTLYTLIIPAKKLHPVEEECINLIRDKNLYHSVTYEKDLINSAESLIHQNNSL
ncbi:diphthine synthase [Ignisphaera sp. 4213-co]|uniref:Diphthine synthase n=1 Tax=Ignisphaera cupida TaxID=3050454 RepID=A0ABD4Z3A5_9CREN|nr:diphthine synthase [Ignisphaera sp. 4213-co]MDK6027791.1 diphthine synthase [Ignisphaera sp. 4213-co]